MWLLILLVIAGVAIFAVHQVASKMGTGSRRWPLVAKPALSEREQILYQRLVAAFPDHIVLAQVALSQIISVMSNVADRQALQNKFFRLVADFVLCRPDFNVVAVIELDDSTHAHPNRQDADARKTKAIVDAGLQLVRLPTGPIPSIESLRQHFHYGAANGNGDPIFADPATSPMRMDPEIKAVLRPLLNLALVGIVIVVGWVIYSQVIAMAIPKVVVARPVAMRAAPGIPTADSSRVNAALEQAEQRRVQAQQALAAQMAADAAAKRKAQAWQAYYKAPASCDDPPTWADQVECGNRYIRAKKAFEKEWQAENAGQ